MDRIISSHKAVFALMLLLTFVVFGNTFLNGWTYDDIPVIVENTDVHSLSGFWEDSYKGRPLRELSYLLDYQLFGDNPAGYHLQQNLWHAANACLLFALMCALGVAPLYALLGTLLFLAHPIQVESVTSLGHRKELLPLFFCFVAVWAYIKSFASSGRQRWLCWLLCLGCYPLILMGNQTAGLLPLVLPLYEYLFVEREKRLLLRYPGLFAVALALAVGLAGYYYARTFDFQLALTSMYAQNGAPGVQAYYPLLLVALKLPLLYLGQILWPVALAPEYVVGFSSEYLQWGSIAGAALLLLLLFGFVRVRKTLPALSFGLGWAFILYLPVSNFLPMHAYAMADRYIYMVLPGVALIVAALLQKVDLKAVNLCMGALLLALATMTVVQNGHWRDEPSLWAQAVKVNPDSKNAHWSAAMTYIENYEAKKAQQHLTQVLEMDRFYVMAYLELAKLQEQEGDLVAAYKNYDFFVRYGQYQFPQKAMKIKNYLAFRRSEGR